MKENIKKNWSETTFRPLSQNEIDIIVEGRRRSSLENLAMRYRRFSNVALICIIWGILFSFNSSFSHELSENSKMIISISYAAYFLVCSIMDRWLYYGIRSIDCATMSVNEVMRRALFYRKRHLQFIAILVPLAIGLIGLIAYYFTFDKYLVYGVACGVIVGLAFGISALMRFLSDYRNILHN